MGCLSGVQNKRSSSSENSADKVAAEQTANIVRDSMSAPPVSVGNVGEGANVSVNVPQNVQRVEAEVNSDMKATHEDSWFTAKTVRLPTSVALCIAGLGILILVFAIRYAIKAAKESNAGAAAVSMADAVLARGIQSVRTLASVSADSTHVAHANAIVAEMESNRGKMNRRK